MMDNLSGINNTSSKAEIIEELIKLFTPYATEPIHSGADFSYMNMYADNFTDQLKKQTCFSDEEIFELLNEACDTSWKKQVNG